MSLTSEEYVFEWPTGPGLDVWTKGYQYKYDLDAGNGCAVCLSPFHDRLYESVGFSLYRCDHFDCGISVHECCAALTLAPDTPDRFFICEAHGFGTKARQEATLGLGLGLGVDNESTPPQLHVTITQHIR
jgi:hypothetical protein